MIFLGKLFIFLAQENILYISRCALNEIVTKAFDFLRIRKLYCMSQVVVLNDIVT